MHECVPGAVGAEVVENPTVRSCAVWGLSAGDKSIRALQLKSTRRVACVHPDEMLISTVIARVYATVFSFALP